MIRLIFFVMMLCLMMTSTAAAQSKKIRQIIDRAPTNYEGGNDFDTTDLLRLPPRRLKKFCTCRLITARAPINYEGGNDFDTTDFFRDDVVFDDDFDCRRAE